MKTGTLYVIAAPSGAGKTSLVAALVDSMSDIGVSVSHTTRPPRSGEQNGADYHFIDQQGFDEMAGAGVFLEHARVFDHSYGTSRVEVVRRLSQGCDVILEIDWQGARQVKQAMPVSVGIFILPPSRAALEQRLKGRGQDSDEVIARRMRDVVAELSHYNEFDYLVVNDSFETARNDLRAIVRSHRLKRAAREPELAALMNDLLK
ncbi:MAG: guanylate kinase [Gammaproteobacteria bacterium]|nr:MAG: guanylate kinase [Gammaproteobacteria bacterium]TND02916.1 MAG: guanylate kinase [Gammaproteobacteria bacterium]